MELSRIVAAAVMAGMFRSRIARVDPPTTSFMSVKYSRFLLSGGYSEKDSVKDESQQIEGR